MAKMDKDYELRMQGMIYASNIASKRGVEGLKEDIRIRNVLKAPMKFTASQIREFWDTLSENLYNTVLTVTALVLHEEYRFGKKRMKEFKAHFDKAVKDATDLDYIGEHYVTLTDYAVYLNERLGMDLNTAVINACADSHDENNSQYHMANIDRVIKELRTHGFKDAAKFLEEKIT